MSKPPKHWNHHNNARLFSINYHIHYIGTQIRASKRRISMYPPQGKRLRQNFPCCTCLDRHYILGSIFHSRQRYLLSQQFPLMEDARYGLSWHTNARPTHIDMITQKTNNTMVAKCSFISLSLFSLGNSTPNRGGYRRRQAQNIPASGAEKLSQWHNRTHLIRKLYELFATFSHGFCRTSRADGLSTGFLESIFRIRWATRGSNPSQSGSDVMTASTISSSVESLVGSNGW